jgi:hypothetical protein
MPARRLVPVLLLSLLAAPACSDDAFTRDDAVARLRDAGLSGRAADCLVEALFDEVGFDDLNVERDPSDEERRIVELFDQACADGSVSRRERQRIEDALDG